MSSGTSSSLESGQRSDDKQTVSLANRDANISTDKQGNITTERTGLTRQETAISWHHTKHDKYRFDQEQRKRIPWYQRARGLDDDEETDWWFASTAIPLLAATLAPLANVLSIAALVTSWRLDLIDPAGGDALLQQLNGIPFEDPRWCYWLNVGSLICGFVGNVFLLFNFTGFVRYIIALPLTIALFFVATGILIGITACMHIYAPPLVDTQVYSQGFWYAIFAAVMYLICSSLLLINMLGYFLGHYPQRFNLSEHQRTLIIQTMLFFVWLAGGGAVFSRIETNLDLPDQRQWAFVDGFYFCDVTILTIGFGDLFPHDDLARGLIFPYSVGGIIMLGLVISSLHKFAGEMGQDKIIKGHMEKQRTRTLERSFTQDREFYEQDSHIGRKQLRHLKISAPYNARKGERRSSIYDTVPGPQQRRTSANGLFSPVGKHLQVQATLHRKKTKLVLLREERDRFNAMRQIQEQTHKFKRWWALTLSVTAFCILWLMGAIVFWQCEKVEQDMTYFQALYLGFVSLLTIGYGDWAPKTNPGRAFFVIWSLVAVPTMTILISDMSSTVIDGFKGLSDRAADLTLLPEKGAIHNFLEKNPWIYNWLLSIRDKRAQKRRQERGMSFHRPSDADAEADATLDTPGDAIPPTLETLATEAEKDHEMPGTLDEGRLAKRLATAIQNVAADLRAEHERKYSYEEWVELTRLIRFTSTDTDDALREEDSRGMVEWDWIGEDSPMISGVSEPEFVLQRLCESLGRYVRRAERRRKKMLDTVAHGDVTLEKDGLSKEELFGSNRGFAGVDRKDHHCEMEDDIAPDEDRKRPI